MQSELVTLPSEWAEKMFETTGNADYLQLYNLWKSRGM